MLIELPKSNQSRFFQNLPDSSSIKFPKSKKVGSNNDKFLASMQTDVIDTFYENVHEEKINYLAWKVYILKPQNPSLNFLCAMDLLDFGQPIRETIRGPNPTSPYYNLMAIYATQPAYVYKKIRAINDERQHKGLHSQANNSHPRAIAKRI